MNVNVEKFENSTAKLTVTVPAGEFEKALDAAYRRNKNRFNVPGFRKGHVTRPIIEKIYGEGIFYEEAAEQTINTSYPEALSESGIRPTSRPEIDVEEIGKGKDFVYTALVALRPPVELGDYMGISVERADETISDEEVDAEIEKVRNQSARIVTVEDEDKTVADGDIAVIDFEGFTDGKPFEGGKGEDYPLTIGSHSFIDDFEDQLTGLKKGDSKQVSVTFPVPYSSKKLEGKDAVFNVVIKEIRKKELPDLDDEFASEVSEFETLDEYRNQVRADLKDKKEKAAVQENEDRIIKAIVDQTRIDFPEAMIETGIDNRIEEIRRSLTSSGMKLEQYLTFVGQTMDEFRNSLREEVTERFKVRLTLEEIAAKENIVPSDEEVDDQIEAMAKRYKITFEDAKKNMSASDIERIREDLAVSEAMDMVVAEAELKEKTDSDFVAPGSIEVPGADETKGTDTD